MKANENGLKFQLGQKAWSVYKHDNEWKVKECLVLGVNLASRYCYFTDSDVGKYEHQEGELFATQAEAEFAVNILRNNTGGIREITLDEVLEVAKADGVKPTPSWICKKFKIAYSRAMELVSESKGGDSE